LVAGVFGIGGPRLSLSTACSSSANALGVALDWIRLGRADVVVAGGTESLCRMTFAGFNALHALSLEPCRPFDRARSGLSLGEGAAMLVVESAEHAARRGARAHAEILSYGNSADAFHLTAPHPDGTGAVLAMRRALARAGLAPEQVDYINAHGTGTPLNDASEAAALKAVFGERVRSIPVTSTKSLIGHLLGSAGAVEAVCTVLGLARREVHPMPDAGEPDPALGLDLVLGVPRPLSRAGCAISTSLAFGGANAVLVFTRKAGA
jgi:3-oxoacyl-[acyl-carrier-protein] synthase II